MIKMLTSTYYNGKQYKQDNVYSVDDKTKERWVKNGIAIAEHEEQSPAPDYPDTKPAARRKKIQKEEAADEEN